MKALLKFNRQSPRKVRLVADMVRGKKVDEALKILHFTPKKATRSMEKVLLSAVANAKENGGKKEDELVVKEIMIDKGFTMKRSRPRAFGRAFPVHKHTSHIRITLGEQNSNSKTQKPKSQTKNISSEKNVTKKSKAKTSDKKKDATKETATKPKTDK